MSTPQIANQSTSPSARLGISSCLLGEEVRFNGGHVRNHFLIATLGNWIEWIPVCPEVEVGMGVPRENLRLIGDWRNPSMVAPKSGTDHTESMKSWSQQRVQELKALDLDGFVLKKDSPSCGPFRVKVYDHNTVPARNGRGLFAAQLMETLPLLPVEDEGRLNDPRLRENFIERIFAYRRWNDLMADPTAAKLVQFQADQKLTLMAHSPQGQKDLGRLVAQAGSEPLEETLKSYGKLLMEILSTITKPSRHVNVLQHVMGFLKEHIDSDDKQELLQLIESYRQGLVPLIVPITLLRHHLRRHSSHEWLARQVYLDPYPAELMLRNHV
jgi:uncharacterized protein YbgA (DUF1722 family)/uncharacterized protein YbbK (DUF523 family)